MVAKVGLNFMSQLVEAKRIKPAAILDVEAYNDHYGHQAGDTALV
jgi:PleD family two-component response regulator